MPEQRRRFKQTKSLKERLTEEAASLRQQAELLQPGASREAILRRARQADTASHVDDWLSSSELQPPK